MLVKQLPIPSVSAALRETRKRGEAKSIAAMYGTHVNKTRAWTMEPDASTALKSPLAVYWGRALKQLSAETDKTAFAQIGRCLLELMTERNRRRGVFINETDRAAAALRVVRYSAELAELCDKTDWHNRRRAAKVLIFISLNLAKLLAASVAAPAQEAPIAAPVLRMSLVCH